MDNGKEIINSDIYARSEASAVILDVSNDGLINL